MLGISETTFRRFKESEFGKRVYLLVRLFIPIYVPVLLLLFIYVQPSIPLIGSGNSDDRRFSLIVTSTVFLLIVFLINVSIILDSVAYAYGIRRPHYSSKKGFVFLRAQTSSATLFVKSILTSYFSVLLCFAVIYILISVYDPLAFNEGKQLEILASIYFTVTTAATGGFGDIHAVSPLARFFVTIQIIVSFLFTIFIFSTVVGMSKIKSTKPPKPIRRKPKPKEDL